MYCSFCKKPCEAKAEESYCYSTGYTTEHVSSCCAEPLVDSNNDPLTESQIEEILHRERQDQFDPSDAPGARGFLGNPRGPH